MEFNLAFKALNYVYIEEFFKQNFKQFPIISTSSLLTLTHQLRKNQFPRSRPPRNSLTDKKVTVYPWQLDGKRRHRPTALPSVATHVTECHRAWVM